MARPILILVTLAALLVSAAPASAQQTTLQVQIQDIPEAFPEMSSNASAAATFRVQVTMTNVFCPQGAQIPVRLQTTAASPPPFFSVEEPEPITFNVPAGAYSGVEGQGQPYRATQDATVQVATQEVTDNATVGVTVQAFVDGLPEGCTGTSAPGAAQSEPHLVTANVVAPPPPPEPEPEPESRGLPGPGLVGLALALAGALLVLRRR